MANTFECGRPENEPCEYLRAGRATAVPALELARIRAVLNAVFEARRTRAVIALDSIAIRKAA